MILKRLEGNLYYVAFCLALVPLLLSRDFTPANELRYLSVADAASLNHTFFTFTNHGEPYADKPPLYFWFVMLGKWLFGTHQMWFLSLLSLVPAIVIVKTMERWTHAELDKSTASAARMLLLTCGFFMVLAVTLRMDMLMCMFIVLALKAFYQMAVKADTGNKQRWLFPLYVFLAIFSKGPFGLLIPLCSTFVFLWWKGRLRQFGRYWGWRTWGVLAAGCLLWFGAVYIEGGKDYLDNLLFHQTFDRALNAFHHKKPFYFYAVSVWYAMAPWSLLVLGPLIALFRERTILTDLRRFYCSIVLSTFILLSCVSSKLEIYLLPAFPFMVYLAALYLPRFRTTTWLNTLFAVTAVLFTLVLPEIIFLSRRETTAYVGQTMVYVAAALLSLCGVLALWNRFRRRKDLVACVRTLAIGVTCAIFAGGLAVPSLNPWIGYGALCGKARTLAKSKGAEGFAAWNMGRAENMDVYLGSPVKVIEEQDRQKIRTLHRTVLMLRERDLKYLGRNDARVVGPYAAVYVK